MASLKLGRAVQLPTGRCQPCGVLRNVKPFAGNRRMKQICRAEGQVGEVDLEAQVEMFMKRQAELESGAAFVRAKDPETIIGADVVSDEEAKNFCREIFDVLKNLKDNRDMSVNEVKLVVSIEDPRTKERRAQGIEDERGVSRDEMALALTDVAEGRIPKDRIALKCLYEEIQLWPFLDTPTEAAAKSSAASTPDYSALQNGDTVVKPYIMGKEARGNDKPQGIMDMLPDWVGYGALYGISVIPALLALSAILVLFYNSLR